MELSHFTHTQSISISLPRKSLRFPVHMCCLAHGGADQTPGWKPRKGGKNSFFKEERRENQLGKRMRSLLKARAINQLVWSGSGPWSDLWSPNIQGKRRYTQQRAWSGEALTSIWSCQLNNDFYIIYRNKIPSWAILKAWMPRNVKDGTRATCLPGPPDILVRISNFNSSGN